MMFSWVSEEWQVSFFKYSRSLLLIIICSLLFCSLSLNAGMFGRDEITHDAIVSDTTVIHIPSKKYVVICFDELFEDKLYDCYTMEVVEFLGCIDDIYLKRAPEPTPTPIPIPYNEVNIPKD